MERTGPIRPTTQHNTTDTAFNRTPWYHAHRHHKLARHRTPRTTAKFAEGASAVELAPANSSSSGIRDRKLGRQTGSWFQHPVRQRAQQHHGPHINTGQLPSCIPCSTCTLKRAVFRVGQRQVPARAGLPFISRTNSSYIGKGWSGIGGRSPFTTFPMRTRGDDSAKPPRKQTNAAQRGLHCQSQNIHTNAGPGLDKREGAWHGTHPWRRDA